MAWIDFKEDADDGDRLKEIYDRVRDRKTGHVDHIMSIHSLHPEGLEAHHQLYSAVMRPSKGLRKAEREMIALVVSKINQCHY